MKKIVLIVAATVIAAISFAQVHVRGYTRKNGTYVAPYVRSSPDHNPYNNYSYPGNTNPVTGKVTTGNPDTYLNNYYTKPKIHFSQYFATPEFFGAPISSNKIYFHDNVGRPITYMLKFENGSTLCKYRIYDLHDIYIGHLTLFPDGTYFLYDLNDNQL